jgi:hypothetical protein
MNYIERIIQWFEDRAQMATSTTISPRQCREIANKMRADYTPPPPVPQGWCDKPGQHAPGCDCASLMQEPDPYDPNDP